MLRQALGATANCAKSLSSPIGRQFSSVPHPRCKAQVEQVLEQAKSTVSATYKTVKPTGTDEDKTTRRNQLIWLVKHSFGKDATTDTKPSPHERLWDTGRVQDGEQDGESPTPVWEGPTVWPHLWFVVFF